MKVRTKKLHGNAYPPVYWKHPRRIYEPGERDRENLVAAGLVENVDETDSEEASSDAGAGES
ncbi:hypothetical protein [Aurantiacibacter luteus]|uniref:Uncharacterized protein n=1 Tax=Aurantiacibacter luteus TaxID=1581420 RepID=A0A0G9MP21_9SPHN|nr:hypothetical protein [Aurantiacibacter luteus]KLE32455.1 hypothetical protein AAW00_13590 [Aurantiacibacter luteus]